MDEITNGTMNTADKKKRIRVLEKEIRYHQDLYYNKQPEISDADFDELWDELQRLDPENKLFKTVGTDTGEGFQKAEHIIPMGSQEKAANPAQFLTWVRKMPFTEFLVQYKLDGASLELQYRNGIFEKAVTRGNGKVGDDVTANAKKFQGIVQNLGVNFSGGIRGEIIMKRSMHKKYYADKANCRNAANGLMKRKDGSGSEHLTLICYDAAATDDIASGKAANEFFSNETEKLTWLQSLGFITVEQKVFTSAEAVIQYRSEVMELRSQLDYDIDGLVIKNNKIDLADVSRARPEKQIAFKFSLEEAVSTLLDVEWSESGATYTPIAIIEPVRLAGTTVRRASLANPKIISELGLKLGSRVVVTKRGEIIPKIESVVATPYDAREISLPKVCSSCGAELVNEQTRLYCPNPQCKKLIHHRLEKWIAVLDIREFGAKLLEQLFAMGRLHSVSDIYTLQVSELASLDRMGELSARKVINSINAKRTIRLAQFIAGFDIEGIGELMAQKLIDAGYNSFEKLLTARESELSQVYNFGEILARNFVSGLRICKAEMQELLASGTIIIQDEIKGGTLSGLSFCFTGELNSMKRAEAEKRVKEKGGSIKSSVTKDLSYLVTNTPDSGSSKNEKAKSLSVKIINEKAFLEMIHGDTTEA